MDPTAPFARLRDTRPARTALRDVIDRHTRPPEPDCIAELLPLATVPPDLRTQAQSRARNLVEKLRAKGARGPVERLVHEYALSSQEGVALMCLAEALLRIPDTDTRDALIRDKIAHGDWRAHLGHSPSIFVNAATWGLVVTGKLAATNSEAGLAATLTRLIARSGEPIIRRGVDMAMRMMGEQFVTGQTIAEALARARRFEAQGFRYSYDMLGEAAVTSADAVRYLASYEQAIHAIGQVAAGRGPYEAPGISIKLSALHPRYQAAQRDRVMTELLPRLLGLVRLARHYDIGINIDAEEADRLDISLDLLEALCLDADLAGWNGIGFVVQAYQKRAPYVVDWVIDLARRTGHRIMVRLVKGAYWDSEIKRAQIDGMTDFPVYTRKVHTDLSYIAVAKRLLAARDAVFPQFATHNALTLSTVLALAGPAFTPGDYEFQCLHGMGEPLYEEVVGADKLGRPCRIYAPVGTHETLLAYLVRRLLENGANTSFVNQIQDSTIPIDSLIADPASVIAAQNPGGAPHPQIARPPALFGAARQNSRGMDLVDEPTLHALNQALAAANAQDWTAASASGGLPPRPVPNPADGRVVGMVSEADETAIAAAVAAAAASDWSATPPGRRAAILEDAAARMEADAPALMALAVREAGKSLPNAVGEVREATDFLRYYAAQARATLDGTQPLGPVLCISPWNFPLAIFTGQVAAALAAGNPVLAKPAEETPLIAAHAVRLLHAAGVPEAALHLLPGDGTVGARLVSDPAVAAVMFTGSTEVARLIAQSLAGRLAPDGAPIPLIAETGGQNAMIVDSSALTEQVVADVLLSAFDSAGQRCSALRVLCVQEDVADRTLAMLKGAMAELAIGNPDDLATDVGPVISAEARTNILRHIAAMRDAGCPIHQTPMLHVPPGGLFVPPTLIEIDSLARLTREIFGPVLHVVRYRREALEDLMAAVNATGYGLTFGIHTRLDETIAELTARAGAGNLYVNRNMIGAVVGVQPFGGHALSGTGPKAGGPLYLRRLVTGAASAHLPQGQAPEVAEAWMRRVRRGKSVLARAPLGASIDLVGPVGERNQYRLVARGAVLCVAADPAALQDQITAVLATGNRAIVPEAALADLPPGFEDWIVADGAADPAAALHDGDTAARMALARQLASRPGPIVPLLTAGAEGYPLEFLVLEQSISTNTAAAGGNAALMTLAAA